MTKNIYAVMYSGNSRIFKDLNQEIAAFSRREAVERFYASRLNENYFPEDELSWGGLVEDCDGNVIADANDETIEYDGGYFFAEQLTTV